MSKFWTIVGAVAGVLAVMVTVVLFVQQRRDEHQRQPLKSIEISNADAPVLVAVPDIPGKSKLAILYAGKPIPMYAVLRATVRNVGNVSIRPTDYVVPIRLQLRNVTEIVEITLAHQAPPDLGASAIKAGANVQLTPILLNPGDEYSVDIGVSAPKGVLPAVASVTGRIEGVPRIRFNAFRNRLAEVESSRSRLETLYRAQALMTLLALGFAAAGLVPRLRGLIRGGP